MCRCFRQRSGVMPTPVAECHAARHSQEDLSKMEIIRRMKRWLARKVFWPERANLRELKGLGGP